MTLSLYTQLLAAQAHAERLRAENPPKPLHPNHQLALDALREAGRPMTTNEIRDALGNGSKLVFEWMSRLQQEGLVTSTLIRTGRWQKAVRVWSMPEEE